MSKKRVNIILSEEALQRADASGNRSQYIEELIMDNHSRPLEVVPLQQLKDLLEDMGTPSKNNSSAEPSGVAFKKLGITTADKLETYEPIQE